MDRGEAYELLVQMMNEFRDEVVSSAPPDAPSTKSGDRQGRSGLLYAIEVEAITQPDGRILFKGSASEHNPHKSQRIEESFIV